MIINSQPNTTGNDTSYNIFLVTVSQVFLSALITDKKFCINLLTNGIRKLYLPSDGCACMTISYLEDVFFKRAFTICQDFIKIGHMVRKSTVEELIDEIEKVLVELKQLPLLLSKINPPNKDWLETVLYSIRPLHTWFSIQDSAPHITIDNE